MLPPDEDYLVTCTEPKPDDQSRALELDRRFGEWSEGAAPRFLSQAKGEASAQAISDVEEAFQRQFANSGAGAIHGSLHFRYLRASLGGLSQPEARDRFEMAEKLLSEYTALAQWDLYGRAKSPDVIVFHGGSTPVTDRRRNIAAGFTLYAGYSWMPVLRPGGSYGSSFYVCRLPIRLVTFTYWLPFGQSGKDNSHDCEIACRDQLVLDPSSSGAFALDDSGHDLARKFSEHRAPRPGGDWSLLSKLITA